MKKLILSLLCMISLTAVTTPVALADQSQYKKLSISGKTKYKPLDLPSDSVKKFSRLTWSTNMVEWLFFAPNVGVEFDLKDPTLISCPSIFLQFSYRPGKQDFMDKQNYGTNALYYWRARAEYRWHFRLNERKEQRRGLAKTAMWADEKFFTKKIEVEVPDTAARNRGEEYAMTTVLSKDARIQQKIDSTVYSTNNNKTELFPGRYYLGAYGEYANLTFRNDMIPVFGDNMKDGTMYSIGLTGGYDFPGFNYNHKCFLQWSVGASLGVFWYQYDEYAKNNVAPVSVDNNKILPFITELKVALNFRNTTITKKYWQPDPKVYLDNITRNHDDSIHMAELDSVLKEHPVIINVTSVNGFDSSFVETVDKNMIVSAFRQATGLTYLLPPDFNMLEHAETSLNNKELSDNYFIEYVTTNRLRNYNDSVFISDRKNLPFKVQIAGREEADSLKKSFVDSLKNYYAANENSRPIFYGEPATKDSLKGFISKDSIAAYFSRIWGHTLDTSMIRALYARRVEVEDDGTSTTYYDSVITDSMINRRESYAMFIQFHPQVTLSGEDEGVGRFNVAMAGADRARELYNMTATFINKIARGGMSIRVSRPWDGKSDTFADRVTKQEVFEKMLALGLDSTFDSNVIHISDSIYAYNVGGKDLERDTIVFNFGVTENELRLPLTVDDSVGRARAMALFNDTIRPWKDENYWVISQGLYDDDPKVPGYHDTITDEWLVKPEKLAEAINDILFTHIQPYMIDTVVWRAPKNPYKNGQYAGKYRAQARMIFHREIRTRNGEMMGTNIPYLIVPVETKEEAGFIDPKPELVADSTVSAVRDSVVYVLDSLGNVIDSTIIQIEVVNVAGDSLLSSIADSLKNTLDSNALAQAVDTVHIVTVAEATEASKVAAAAAKETAATAKSAAAAAKKAAADVSKKQKAAAAAIKKAQASTKNIQDSTIVTTDSIAYVKDSLGNVIDSTVVTIENKIAHELDSVEAAAVMARDSIIAAENAAVEAAVHYADSLKAFADSAAVLAAEAKTAAAEAKKAIAEAKKAEKAAAAEAKKRAKEEAAAAKAAAKAATAEVTTPAVAPSSSSEPAAATPAASQTTAPAQSNGSAPTAAAPVRTAFMEDETPATPVDTTHVVTVAEATEASKVAAVASKEAVAESKAAAAAVKKAKADAAKAEKAAAAALKNVPAAEADSTGEVDPAVAEAKMVADSLQNIANLAQQAVDSLQSVADAAVQKVNDTKVAAAEAKKAIAEAKKAEKAAAAAAKQRAKEEAAAAKAAAAAEKAAAKEAAEAAKNATKEEVTETVETVASEAAQVVEGAVETATEAAEEVPAMTEKEAKAAAKKAAAEAKKKAKEEAAAAKKAAAEAKKKAKEEAAAAKAAAEQAAEQVSETVEETTEAKE